MLLQKTNAIIDSISSVCLNLFVEQGDCSKLIGKKSEKQDEFDNGAEFLVEPMLKKLSHGLHSRILKTACNVLGVKGWWKDQKGYGGYVRVFYFTALLCNRSEDFVLGIILEPHLHPAPPFFQFSRKHSTSTLFHDLYFNIFKNFNVQSNFFCPCNVNKMSSFVPNVFMFLNGQNLFASMFSLIMSNGSKRVFKAVV